MKPNIEAAAGHLFDLYYQYTSNSDLVALQALTEKAYVLHERLKRFPVKNPGLLELDEFLVVKMLRNHYVHCDEFLGKAYSVDKTFAQRNNLDLLRVCLIEKKTANQAINAEPSLEFGEQEKITKIRSQLVDFGDYYNIEPTIFNFMVKVYEKLNSLKLSVPGKGYSDMQRSYKNEVYHNYPHYVPLTSLNISNEDILSNIKPLEAANLHAAEGLLSEKEDPFNSISTLNLDLVDYSAAIYEGEDYEVMRDALLSKITNDPDALLLACALPKHLGLAFLPSRGGNMGEITGFNIRKQKEAFEASNIGLKPQFYETTALDLLVIFFHDDIVFPVTLPKEKLFNIRAENKRKSDSIQFNFPGTAPFEVNVPRTSETHFGRKLGRNDPCHCGSGKKYKKCCMH
ncbi:YecA family protein [Vibrio crassostreae]|uniref:YecA family protein n=1 Tax=Vibrio crassostreae TaxID=246167 RepID=UPI003BB7A7BB